MKEYELEVTVTERHYVTIEAESPSDARRKATEQAFSGSEIIKVKVLGSRNVP